MDVSVIIPTHNRSESVIHAIESIYRQRVKCSVEIIVVDDCSSDNTKEIVLNFDASIKLLRHEEKTNASAARNSGIQAASGKIICFLDSDDVWLPRHLAHALDLLKDKAIDGVMSSFKQRQAEYVVERVLEPKCPLQDVANYVFAREGDIRSSGLVVRADTARQVLFDASLEKHQDWDFAIRFVEEHRYNLVTSAEITFEINDGQPDRMSSGVNPQATQRFMQKHQHRLTRRSRFRAYWMLARNERKANGRDLLFWRYWSSALASSTAVDELMKLTLVAMPLGEKLTAKVFIIKKRFGY